MTVLPVQEIIAENPTFADHPDCKDSFIPSVNYYRS